MDLIALRLVLVLSVLGSLLGEDDVPGNLTDLLKCKVSHLGLDYVGDIARSESKVRCQSWTASSPVHKVDSSFTDINFSDFSMKKSKNYCRNPNKEPLGPWCYTMDSDLMYETCAVPLCSFTHCRTTGPGMEYGGNQKKSSSDRKCLKWNKNRNKVKSGKDTKKIDKFNKVKFPDEDVKSAKKFCRNPDGDIGGPWCFVEVDDSDAVEKEYCDIPFCDDPDCVVFTRNSSTYSQYIKFDEKLENFTFGVKIWHPDDYLDATAQLVLTLFPLDVSGKRLEDFGIGLEIFISNKVSALTFGNKDNWEFEKTVGILKSTSYTYFSLSWDSGFITLNEQGKVKPIFLSEYRTKSNLLGFKKNKFNYYSSKGKNLLWSFPFCDDNNACDVHTTSNANFTHFFPLGQSLGADLHFFVRAHHSAYIKLVPTPVSGFPSIIIQLQREDDFTRIIAMEFQKGPSTVLKEFRIHNLISFWKFNEFVVSLFASTFQLHVTKDASAHLLAEFSHPVVRKLRWFSVGSENSLAYWTFFCQPSVEDVPPPAWLPECKLSDDEPNYKGTQSVTSEGLQCLPWGSQLLVPDDEFGDQKEAFKNWNYCRDPQKEKKGTYCYVLENNNSKKKYCNLRRCKSAECKMAGTGNDYIGKVNTTRSNRTCQYWTEDTEETQEVSTNSSKEIIKRNADEKVQIHKVKQEYLNDSLYADTTVSGAENFCRNPSRNIAGSWCYTLDKKVPQDLCNIRDCDKPEECTIILRGKQGLRRVYILPQWKERGSHSGLQFALKEWDPDQSDGFSMEFTPFKLFPSLKLTIGAENNQKIQLKNNSKTMKERTMPHLISSGKWTEFWLQIRKGEILLGLQGVPTSLFEWKNEDAEFEPRYVAFSTTKGNPIGVYFNCEQCHTETVKATSFGKIFPIGLWREERPYHNHLDLKVRGTGILLLPLMDLPGSGEYYMITLVKQDIHLSFVYPEGTIILISKKAEFRLETDSWMHLQINFTETELIMTMNDTVTLEYKRKTPMMIYYFSIGSSAGWITWSANCDPLDLDGPPLDGGWSSWSEWECTVSCGGGEGFRTRTCSNPTPNIFGNMCEGPSTSTGKCNDFECGDISPKTFGKIRESLRNHHHSLVVKENDLVHLENDHKLLDLISVESPDAYYEWSLNGLIITNQQGVIEVRNDDIYINKAKNWDSGLYVCMLFRVNGQRVVIKVISLAVRSRKVDISTRASLSVTLPTHSVILGYIYTDLSLKWVINGTTHIDHGLTTLAAVSMEIVNNLSMSQTGEWRSVVEQKDLGFTWITNIVRIEVKSKPTIYTHLMEDHLTAPIFSWLKTETNVMIFLVFVVCFIIALVITCLILYLKFGTLPSPYKKNRV